MASAGSVAIWARALSPLGAVAGSGVRATRISPRLPSPLPYGGLPSGRFGAWDLGRPASAFS